MALPKQLQPALTPEELTFLAEEEAINVVPFFSMSKIRLLSVSLSVFVLAKRGERILLTVTPAAYFPLPCSTPPNNPTN